MSVKELLQRARRRLRTLGRVDETEPRASSAEETVRALLDDLVDRSVEAAAPSRIPSMLRQGVDREHYRQALAILLEEAREEGREEATDALSERIGWECACRCLEHRRIACPRCLNVFGCPVHSEVSAEDLRPGALRDPDALARELHETRRELSEEEIRTWDELSDETRDVLVEVARRVVCCRAARGGPDAGVRD